MVVADTLLVTEGGIQNTLVAFLVVHGLVPLFSNWSSLNHWLNFLPFGKPENNMKD
jgi:phage-related holin